MDRERETGEEVEDGEGEGEACVVTPLWYGDCQ